MYTLKEIESKGLFYLELASFDEKSKAEICLTQGGRLSNLSFENTQILEDFDSSSYRDNYASAILFPFANRIKNGRYTFEDYKYKLECNETNKNNALHGLVYNKKFDLIDKELTLNFASVTLQYKDYGKCKGFPFKFLLELTYILSKKGITLAIKVKNKGEKTFPFTLGWHPYFYTSDLYKSSIDFKSDKEYVFNKQQIITGTTALDIEMPFNLKDVNLDNGYPLENDEIDFSTPKYSVNIKSTSKENYLQLYTPLQGNTIAIEPMTGAADNFNNKIGLQTLQPNQTFLVKWIIAIETTITKLNTN